MSTPAFDLLAPIPEIPRDRFGRPMIVPPNGGRPVAYTRCTTYVGALEDTYNLGAWQQRMVAAGLAARPDLHLRAASLGAPPPKGATPAEQAAEKRWKAAMNEVADAAREAAAASAAATIGTSLHALTEAMDRGQTLGAVPEQWRKHLDNYARATQKLTAVGIERFLVEDGLKIGGTADRIVRIDGHDGLLIADVKTGSIEYGAGKIAMQLAVYAHSLAYDPASGARQPVEGLRTDRGVIIRLDAATGNCELHWADLTAGWDAVQLATQVRAWRARKNLLVPAADLAGPDALPAAVPEPALDAPFAPAVPVLSDAAQAVMVAIEHAKTVDDLVGLWTVADARGLWSDAMTVAAKARMNVLQATAA